MSRPDWTARAGWTAVVCFIAFGLIYAWRAIHTEADEPCRDQAIDPGWVNECKHPKQKLLVEQGVPICRCTPEVPR